MHPGPLWARQQQKYVKHIRACWHRDIVTYVHKAMYLRQQHAVMMQHITITSIIITAIPAMIAMAVKERPKMIPSSFWLPSTLPSGTGTTSDNM